MTVGLPAALIATVFWRKFQKKQSAIVSLFSSSLNTNILLNALNAGKFTGLAATMSE
jgi:hypothetical protein